MKGGVADIKERWWALPLCFNQRFTSLHYTADGRKFMSLKKNPSLFSLFTSFFMHKIFTTIATCASDISALIKAWIDTEESEKNLCVNSIADWCQRKTEGVYFSFCIGLTSNWFMIPVAFGYFVCMMCDFAFVTSWNHHQIFPMLIKWICRAGESYLLHWIEPRGLYLESS